MDPLQDAVMIHASSQQTRFYIIEQNKSTEIDLKGVDISLAPSPTTAGDGSASKRKKAPRTQGLEILSNAELRVKTGVHYGLVGRNGTGKSTVLRAISERLIPGFPPRIRIASLQQLTSGSDSVDPASFKVLERVVQGDLYRNGLVRDCDVLTKALSGGDPAVIARAYRQLKHEELHKEFLEIERTARLRSGARGYDARKALKDGEVRMAASIEHLHSVESADSTALDADAQQAAQLQAELQSQLETVTARDVEKKALHILSGLGFTATLLAKRFGELSGGWQMRCLLASALTQTADLLILDEPTNYLDMFGILWLQTHLLTALDPQTSILLVSHDRDFVNAVCAELILLRDKTLIYFPGSLDAYDKSVQDKTLQMSRMKEAQEKQIEHISKTIAQNMKQGRKTGDENKLRQAKSRQKKLDDRMGVEVSAKGGRFKLNRDLAGYHLTSRSNVEIPEQERGVEISLPEVPELRFPGSLVSLEGVGFTYKGSGGGGGGGGDGGSKKPAALQDVDLVVHLGDRVGLVGLNGAGKSTLVNLIIGKLAPSKGAVTKHPRLKVAYYSQHAVDGLRDLGVASPSATALSLLTERHSEADDEPVLRKHLARVGLVGRTASDVPIAKLSGGQLVRLALCLQVMDPPHLFVLDEPTTHLDLPSVNALAAALAGFDGAIVLVTHDRYFLRVVVEGERMDLEDSDEEDEGNEAEEMEERRRRVVYEVKKGKVALKSGGVEAWSSAVERLVQKMRDSEVG